MIPLSSGTGVTTFSVPAGGAYSFVNYNGSQWYMVASNSADQLINVLPTTNGGTGLSTIGTAGQALVVNGGATGLTYTSVVGTQGPQGFQGASGAQGANGAQGSQGSQGAQGNQGAQGSQGNQGYQGNQGNQGTQGTAGTNGAQGSQGNQGQSGFQFSNFNTQSSNYTTFLVDATQIILMNSSSAVTISIPTHANVAYASGTQLNILNIGTGTVTISAANTGTTGIASTGAVSYAPKLRTQYSQATAIQTYFDTWYVVGDII
jgi:hypothetical protein